MKVPPNLSKSTMLVLKAMVTWGSLSGTPHMK